LLPAPPLAPLPPSAMVHATASRHVDLLLSPSDDVIEEMLRREMDQLDGLRSRCAPALLRDPCGRAPPPVNDSTVMTSALALPHWASAWAPA
jgi:hypothetical protein